MEFIMENVGLAAFAAFLAAMVAGFAIAKSLASDEDERDREAYERLRERWFTKMDERENEDEGR